MEPILAERMGRLGTETAFEVLARAKALEAKGKSIVSLSIGQPDFRTPEHIVEAAIKALRDGHHGYTPANGILPLREAVAADLHRRLGAKVAPDQVLIVPGGKVTMFFAIMMLGEPGAEIVYPNPGFPIYESVIKFSGATPVALPLLEKNGFAFEADDILSRLTERTRLVILNSPANPTGGVTPKDQVDKLVAGLAKFPKVAIMSDEIYGQMTYDGRAHVTLLNYPELADRLILLDGWSKTYAMTGWRLGYSVWPKSMIAHAERLAVVQRVTGQLRQRFAPAVVAAVAARENMLGVGVAVAMQVARDAPRHDLRVAVVPRGVFDQRRDQQRLILHGSAHPAPPSACWDSGTQAARASIGYDGGPR
jgi:aspartate/methionine/tyrosine aminotransferase